MTRTGKPARRGDSVTSQPASQPADAGQPGPDPSNTPVEELLDCLEPDDDVLDRLTPPDPAEASGGEPGAPDQ